MYMVLMSKTLTKRWFQEIIAHLKVLLLNAYFRENARSDKKGMRFRQRARL